MAGKRIILTGLAVAMCCASAAEAAPENGPQVIPGIRKAMRTPAPVYTALPAELCAIAVAAVRYQADEEPVSALFYQAGKAVGPDCAGAYAKAGLKVATSRGEQMSEVGLPRQAAGGEVEIGVSYGCVKVFCMGGDDYFLYRRNGRWQVDTSRPGGTWIR